MRYTILLFLLILLSCSTIDTLTEGSTEFSFSSESESFIINSSFQFNEQFYYLDSTSFSGERVCTLITNGLIDTIETSEISYEFTPALEDTIIVTQPSGIKVQVRRVDEYFYEDGAQKAHNALFIQKKIDGFYLHSYINTQGSEVHIDTSEQYIFPLKPISGKIYTGDSTQNTSEKRNSWSSACTSPLFIDYSNDFYGSHSMIEGAFALEAKNQPPYKINGAQFRDGIDVKTYHSAQAEYKSGNVFVQEQVRITETNYHFKQWGLAEKRALAVRERRVGSETIHVWRDHFVLGQEF